MRLCSRGITPAYAGSTIWYLLDERGEGDHPRACGEHMDDTKKQVRVRESSPRMRGALGMVHGRLHIRGIIPAYAGSTSASLTTRTRTGDHPRVCGEHRALNALKYGPLGSSPRMRGALDGRELLVDVRGIIPAYAGSTARRASSSWRCRDHPRVCGEHFSESSAVTSRRGSSPRMRGALDRLCDGGSAVGIIPAYAGSTLSPASPSCRGRDHPRVCGEHQGLSWYPVASLGSSPRMRGARFRHEGLRLRPGIIPAYAGSTTEPRPRT